MSLLEELLPAASALIGEQELRWFTPLPQFWDELKKFGPEISFVDVGTGRGDLPEEAQAHQIKMIGIDFRVRSGSPVLKRGWGEQWSYSPTCWPLVCRPCHSGFPRAVLKRARDCGAPLLYVGFNKNLARDVGHVKPQLIVSRVGEERESMYLFR